MPNVSPELLALLRCPVTKASLVQDGDSLRSTAPDATGAYPQYRIEDGILLLLRPDQVDPAHHKTSDPGTSATDAGTP